MSIWSRIKNVLSSDAVTHDIDDELQSHLEHAVREGRNANEARKALGSTLRIREQSLDIRLISWLDSLRADAVFGWRQLLKNKLTTAAAVLSLALATGACTAAFRLIDALLLRQLPVTGAARLHVLSHDSINNDGTIRRIDNYDYPMLKQMRTAIKDQAELIAASRPEKTDLTYSADPEMEKAYLQHVSGWMFQTFGLRPAAGRLLTEDDDITHGAHPYAVLSHDYWTRRFAQSPSAIGRAFRLGETSYTIIGIANAGFTGTDPGTITDIFIPVTMNPSSTVGDSWLRALTLIGPEANPTVVASQLQAIFQALREERSKRFQGMPKEQIDRFLREKPSLEPASSGISQMQQTYRKSLTVLGGVVLLVLLIACANVANLMTAQGATRAREMALRISIGAGRWRLLQLVMAESAWIAALSTAAGAVFASWSAHFVLSRISPPDNPARLLLPADWRLLSFTLALTFAVTFILALGPAIRASSASPLTAIKGSDHPHFRNRSMHLLIAAQAAFCFIVIYFSGLFVTSFDRLSNRAIGFSAERVLVLDAVSQQPQPQALWDQAIAQLRQQPNIEAVALAAWPLLQGDANNGFISINGAPPGAIVSNFMNISPGWLDAMKIPLRDGRDFRSTDTRPGAAIVNQAFVREFFKGVNPVGRSFERNGAGGRFEIVGIAGDASYRDVRGQMVPVAFLPLQSIDNKGQIQQRRFATFLIRTKTADPFALSADLRQQLPQMIPGLRIANVRAQTEINNSQTRRERLLAVLASFFSIVALLLAAVGLYGVLNHSVQQRRKEIGIRLAVGAPAKDIIRRLTTSTFAMVICGGALGLAIGIYATQYIESLLYQVKAPDTKVLTIQALAILGATLFAVLPPAIRAVRINPVKVLRME